MNYEDIVKCLGVCGLDCSRCADYAHGEVREHSIRLLELLNNYQRVATMKEDKNPVFRGYPQFEQILASFSQGVCGGCRSNGVQCPIQCHAKSCQREKGVDFCFQCHKYPCNQQFSGGLRERWIRINDRMKEIGVLEYYHEQAKLPRY